MLRRLFRDTLKARKRDRRRRKGSAPEGLKRLNRLALEPLEPRFLLAPVISGTTQPSNLVGSSPVAIPSTVTDATATISSVSLAYELSVPSSPAFSESFGKTPTPSGQTWGGGAGTGTDNVWSASGTAFKLNATANYVSSNPNCGLQYACNKTSGSITSAAINMAGVSATVQFYADMSGTTSSDTWTLEFGSSATGPFTPITSLTTLGTSSRGFTEYNCVITNSSLLNSAEYLHFAFTGGGTGDGGLIYLDQISVMVQPSGGIVAMTAGANNTYSAQIPAEPLGSTVSYYVVATDSQGYSTFDPPAAPATPYSYTVPSVTITNTTQPPAAVAPNSAVQITTDISSQSALTAVNLIYNSGSGWNPVAMSNEGNGVYEASIPQFAAGTTVQYYISATNSAGFTATDPSTAPAYRIRTRCRVRRASSARHNCRRPLRRRRWCGSPQTFPRRSP